MGIGSLLVDSVFQRDIPAVQGHLVVDWKLPWAGLHVVKSATSIPAGAWSDRVGRRTMIAAFVCSIIRSSLELALTGRMLPEIELDLIQEIQTIEKERARHA